jgi:hypothetical protein
MCFWVAAELLLAFFPSPLREEGGARSAPGEGRPIVYDERIHDHLQHRIGTPQHIIVPETKDSQTLRL